MMLGGGGTPKEVVRAADHYTRRHDERLAVTRKY